MSNLDAWLIRRFEMFAHWVQRWVGVTSYGLARYGFLAGSISAAVYGLDYWLPVLTDDDVGLGLLTFNSAGFVAFMACAQSARQADQEFKNQPSVLPDVEPLCVPMVFRVSAAAVVGLWLLLVAVPPFKTFPQEIARALSNGVFVAWYFLEVAPLPPGESRVSRFVRAIGAFVSRQSSETGA